MPGTHYVLNKYLLIPSPSNKQYIISPFHVLVKLYKIWTLLLSKLLSKAQFLSNAQLQSEYTSLITLCLNIRKGFTILSLDEADFIMFHAYTMVQLLLLSSALALYHYSALKNLKGNVHKKHTIARMYGSLNQTGCSFNEDPWEDFHLDLCIRKSLLIPM